MRQEYPKGTTVYTFYFDYDTSELICKELKVASYDYLDGCQWNIIDEYRLDEEIIETKYYFFKKKKIITHTVIGHLLSDNVDKAKVRFLHNFLTTFTIHNPSKTPERLIKLVALAKTYYNEMVENKPEIVLTGITEKLVPNNRIQYYWR